MNFGPILVEITGSGYIQFKEGHNSKNEVGGVMTMNRFCAPAEKD